MSSPVAPNSPDLDSATRKRVWMVEAYWFFHRSCDRVREEFRRIFPDETEPANRVIQYNVGKFHENGTVANRQKGNSGRPSTSTTSANVERVEELYTENPEMSIRRASYELGIPKSSVQRILRKKVKLYPYKIQTFQELTDYDMERRLEFAREVINRILNKSIDTKKIWFSDEAHFWLTGYVNKQNHRFWAHENPRILETTTLKPKRVTVWCAISEAGIIGPVFFEENVTGERYKRMLRKEFIPFAQGMNAVEDYWFMQDGALPHRTNAVFEYLDEHFPGRVLGLGYSSKYGGGLDWAPYSPDLNPCDYFLWGYLKDQVYREKPRTIEDLKRAVEEKIRTISPETLKNVIRGFEDRLHAVVETDGAHIEQYLH